ncbi:MAG TPA: nucleoside monophosphate kinase [Patescibacteria group bacterium]|nr:nucleoside monophosphate kinase [Patescibacteria group bacterium]
MKIILIGIQGAGKSTQGKLLSEKLHIPYLSTGHIFRELAKEHTPLGRYIKETMNAGYLIPDEKTLTIVSEYLHRPEYVKGYILDGFPRTVHQAQQFENGIDYVFYLKVSDKEALWRLSYRTGSEADGREDDTLSAIRKRIDLFHTHTEPVIDHYRHHHKLKEVDGEQSIEHIHQQIMSVIHSAHSVKDEK